MRNLPFEQTLARSRGSSASSAAAATPLRLAQLRQSLFDAGHIDRLCGVDVAADVEVEVVGRDLLEVRDVRERLDLLEARNAPMAESTAPCSGRKRGKRALPEAARSAPQPSYSQWKDGADDDDSDSL